MAETLGDAWLTEANGEVTPFGAAGHGLRGGIESFDSGGIFSDEPPAGIAVPPTAEVTAREDCANSTAQPRFPRIRRK
jgi:hypothetical protein